MRGTDGRRQRTALMQDAEYFTSQAIRCLQGLADEDSYGEWDRAVALCQEARSIAREKRKLERSAA